MNRRYQVLLVDDERSIREGLQRLFARDFSGWEIAGTASCTEDALLFLAEHRVDLLITDIMMPGSSGLELIEQLRRRQPELDIVIVSGYDNFQFAQKAMQHRVFYYLLKPLNHNELRSVLDEVKAKLSRSDTFGDHSHHGPEYYNSIINEILSDNIEAQQYLTALFPDIMSRYSLLCLDMDLRGATLPATGNDVGYLSQMRQSLKELCAPYCSNGLIFFRSKSLWGIVIDDAHRDCIMDLAGTLREGLALTCGIRASVGISSSHGSGESFSHCFRRGYIAAKAKVILPEAVCCCYETLALAGELVLDERLEEQLVNCVRAGDPDSAAALLESIIGDILPKQPDIYALGRLIRRLTYAVFCRAEKARLMDQELADRFDALQDLKHIHSLADLLDQLGRFLRHAAGLFLQKHASRYNRIIDSTVAHINSHFREDLSLPELAVQAGINANYLCSLFKAETGMTIVEYITFIRMEKAKELLRQSGARLSDISGEVGYRDVKYFIRTFKKNIGVTPNEFRKYSRA